MTMRLLAPALLVALLALSCVQEAIPPEAPAVTPAAAAPDAATAQPASS
jgi:hypothetical protein